MASNINQHTYYSYMTRVLRLPVRDSVGIPNNLAPRCPKLSAIEVTLAAKSIFECLYLVPGSRQFAPFVTIPYAPTPPSPLTLQLLLDFSVFLSNFFPEWPIKFFVRK